jgi:hypothetical protein
VSVKHSHSLGTIWGRHDDSWLGAQYAMEPSSRMDACFERHCGSCRPLSSDGIMSFTPVAVSLPMMILLAPCAASRTSSYWSPNAW